MAVKTPLESKYAVDHSTGCWVWKRPLTTGYGLVLHKGKQRIAHRVVYELRRGRIPDGMVLDHLCRNPGCVNPDHLEPVSIKENTRRGLATKLDLEAVEVLRARYANGEKLADIAESSGMSIGHLSDVFRGSYWEDAGGEIVVSGRTRPKHGKRKISDSQAKEIRQKKSEGKSRTRLAEEYGVSKCTIDRIVSGRLRFSFI